MKRALLIALALAGCGRKDRGFAVTVTVEAGCAGAEASALEVDVLVQPGDRKKKLRVEEKPLFVDGRRRLVVVAPDGATSVKTRVAALAGARLLAAGEVEVEVKGAGIVERAIAFAGCTPPDGDTPHDGAADASFDLASMADLAAADAAPEDAATIDAADVAPADGATPDATYPDAAPDLAPPPDLAPVKLVSLAVTPTNPKVAKGTSLQMRATGTYSNSTVMDLTDTAAWSSDNAAVTVGVKGLVTGVTPMGVAIIEAQQGGIAGRTVVSVTSATLVALTIAPSRPSVAKGHTIKFTASALFSDNSTQDVTDAATWSASDAKVATVAKGVASGVGVGSADIGATLDGQTATTTLTVTSATLQSITVTPVDPQFAKGSTALLVATGTYSDNTTHNVTAQAVWISSDANLVTVDGTGKATAVAVGNAIVSAKLDGVTGTTTVHVTEATLVSITIAPPKPSLAKGSKLQLKATGSYSDTSSQDLTARVTWSSSSDAVATVSNADGSQGLTTGVAPGMVTVTAQSGGVKGTTQLTVTSATLMSVAVTPMAPSTPKGFPVQFKATGTYSDNSTQDITTQVAWTSSTEAVATVSNAPGSQGLATPLAMGMTTVKASQSQASGQTVLTVTSAVLMSITVTPATAMVAKGLSKQYTAMGRYNDNTTENLTMVVTWSSLNGAIAKISNTPGSQGLATAVAANGTATLTAKYTQVTGMATLTATPPVLTSVAVVPAFFKLRPTNKLQCQATAYYSDATQANVTVTSNWVSSRPMVATVNDVFSKGLVTALKAGLCDVTATYMGLVGTTSVTVEN